MSRTTKTFSWLTRSEGPNSQKTRGKEGKLAVKSAKQNFYFPRAQQYWSGGGASGTFATTGNCLDIMVWNWVVVMVGPSSAALWNSVTKALMASSNSEYWQSNDRQQVRYNNWLGRHGNQQLSSLTEKQSQSYNGVSSPTFQNGEKPEVILRSHSSSDCFNHQMTVKNSWNLRNVPAGRAERNLHAHNMTG